MIPYLHANCHWIIFSVVLSICNFLLILHRHRLEGGRRWSTSLCLISSFQLLSLFSRIHSRWWKKIFLRKKLISERERKKKREKKEEPPFPDSSFFTTFYSRWKSCSLLFTDEEDDVPEVQFSLSFSSSFHLGREGMFHLRREGIRRGKSIRFTLICKLLERADHLWIRFPREDKYSQDNEQGGSEFEQWWFTRKEGTEFSLSLSIYSNYFSPLT